MNNFDNFFDNLFPLRPLFPFVQSVLPTVFDDSLSYLETLGKVVKALNDTESNVNTLEQAVRAFAADLAEFENLTIYPVNMTFNENTGNYAADKTFADIDAALLEGRTPVLHVLDRDGRNYYSAQLSKAGNTVFYWTTPLFYENGNSVIFRAFINNSDVSGVIASPLDSGAVVVNYTTVSGSDIPVVDKTFEQISAALEDNKPVFLFVDNAYWIPLSRANRTGNDVDGYHYISAEFIYAIPVSTTGGNNLGVGVYSVNTSDAWSVNRYAFPDAGRVNTLIDIKLAQLEGFESVKKLYYNENTGAVAIWDGVQTSPITGEELIINVLSAHNIYPFMQGQGAVTDVFNLYIPLKYDARSANEAVQFYRVVNNNMEIISIPRNSNIATKTSVSIGSADAVLYTVQNLTTAQKTQARQNIGAGTSSVTYNQSTGILTIIDAKAGIETAYPVPSDTVRYGAAQTLTEQQKQQARQNIGVDSNGIFLITAVYSNGEYTFDRNQADILAAIQSGKLPVVRYHTTAGQSDYNVYHEWVFDYYTYDGEDVYIYFSRVDPYGNVSQMRWYASTGKAVVTARPTLPPATAADDGKTPMVNSFGNYQLVTPSASSGTPRISMANTDTTPALDANKFYVFPEMASLSVTLNTPASNTIVNEFHFRFTSGSTATQFDLPATVEIPDDFDVASDTVYEISIIDNYMVYSSWAVGA